MLGKNAMLSCMGTLVFRRHGNQWVKLAHCYNVLPAKLSLILDGFKSSKVRCGLILPPHNVTSSSSFLSALVADVYSTDQAWFNVLKDRYSGGDSLSKFLVKYGDQFDEQKMNNMTTFTVPSPFLQKNNVEFLEVQSTDSQSNDGCHFYINLQGPNPNVFHIWPTVNLNLSSQISDMPFENQVNAPMALNAITNFIGNKNTVNEFLEAMAASNFSKVQQKLESKLTDKEDIFSDLKNRVLENILNTERLYDRNRQLNDEEEKYMGRVEVWSEEAHGELQKEIIPRLNSFVKNQLSLWRVYTYSESKFQLKLLNMVTEPLGGLQMINSLNRIRGELKVNDTIFTRNQVISVKDLNEEAINLHRKINKDIYQNFVLVQLPMILLAIFGVVSGEFSGFSMGALASFGVVLGFSRVLSLWQSLLNGYEMKIIETVRSNIEIMKANLIKEYQKSFAFRKNEYRIKYDLCRSLGASTDK
ncbi:(ZYRO0E05896g) [Zygosaccharomyces parabailii]|uniref:ZYBA0S06-00276g1_1 n=1 Tax=Zygosaccharomyces bailii (strain CLIB 213 / ATCC 58445 / CBS 680 / BCRC 21525 / NBRC 1098 / NCYC 1416 / NRRL Y-2227) TaxID=1333698 RepID=A0A8J2T7T9_ZYGB2|nr:(ZYRO0E05896g) [Zygosaccharomyces parabailii]CDF90088.1 ZYBA0S06-00276g1_1 [Zygosaccharomyces bailii CLIB 213]